MNPSPISMRKSRLIFYLILCNDEGNEEERMEWLFLHPHRSNALGHFQCGGKIAFQYRSSPR